MSDTVIKLRLVAGFLVCFIWLSNLILFVRGLPHNEGITMMSYIFVLYVVIDKIIEIIKERISQNLKIKVNRTLTKDDDVI